MATEQFDLVVVGGGPVGLASALASAKKGKKVVVLEQFVFSNANGSSGDMARMFRTMYTEDFMADLAKTSIGVWDDLIQESGEGMLLWKTGLLNFGDPNYGAGGPEGTLTGPIPNLERLGMSYQELNKTQIEERFPFRGLPDDYLGLWAPDNGVINVPLLHQTLYRLGAAHGVKFYQNAKVSKITTTATEATVIASIDNGSPITFHTNKVALTCGAYINDVLGPSFNTQIDITIWEMVYSYFTINKEAYFPSMWFLFAEDDPANSPDPQKSNLMYGFPALPWALSNHVRIAVDAATRIITNPSQRQIDPAPEDISKTSEFVKKHLPDIEANPTYSGVCLQTNVFDNMYAFGIAPDTFDRVGIFTAGWAMKMVPFLGILMDGLLFGSIDPKYADSLKIVQTHFPLTRVDPSTHLPIYHSRDAQSTVAPKKAVSGSSAKRVPKAEPRFNTGSYALTLINKYIQDQQLHKRTDGCKWAGFVEVVKHIAKKPHPERPFPWFLHKEHLDPKVESTVANIGIVGSGMAGLYAGFMLQSLGIPFEIIEANERIGGRIFTWHFNETEAQPGTPEFYDYFDIGAMRFPVLDTMKRVIGVESEIYKPDGSLYGPDDNVAHYAYGLIHQLNAARPEGTAPITFEKYILSDAKQNSYMQFNGVLKQKKDVAPPPADPFNFGAPSGFGNVPAAEIAQGDAALLAKVYDPLLEALTLNFNDGFQAMMKYDKHSVRTMLLENKLSEPAINYCETLNTGSNLYDEAFSESVMDSFDFSADKWVCISGGTEQITKAFVRQLTPDVIKTKQAVRKIAPTSTGMEVHIQPTGSKTLEKKQYSHVILTPTLGSIRSIDLKECNLSYTKQLAIRTMHYDQSVKVALRFNTRWWQTKFDIVGGSSTTDTPLRTVVYPSYGADTPGTPGVLIVSYTWAQDAARMAAMDDGETIQLCLKLLAEIHGDIVYSEYSGKYKIWSWHDDPYMLGAFALYGPSQFTQLYPGLVAPEVDNKLHLAGEATSVHHAWVIGAFNSGYRAVYNIITGTPSLSSKLDELLLKFGRIDEVEYGDLKGGEDVMVTTKPGLLKSGSVSSAMPEVSKKRTFHRNNRFG